MNESTPHERPEGHVANEPDPDTGAGSETGSGSGLGPGAAPVATGSTASTERGVRPGELSFTELLRWSWRQLTSMRTALILLFLLALAAVPGSLIPQEGVDSFKSQQWQDAHPKLTEVYQKLGLFEVYESPWFSAIYILLMISLIGCIIPRMLVYARALRAKPPKAPRNLLRLPDHAVYRPADTGETSEQVLDRAEAALRKRRYRVVRGEDHVAAERGYLREAGNLLFHLAVVVVLVGFAAGQLFGYKGGVIVLVGGGFSNNLTQYDDFQPGSLFDPEVMEPFHISVDDFDAEWLTSGPRAGQARKFTSHVSWTPKPGEKKREYDLKVNDPLKIGDTEVFLVGHGYAPVITVKDGQGRTLVSGPTIFLPEDQTFRSFGVVKAPGAQPKGLGFQGEFYPTYAFTQATGPYSSFGKDTNPFVSMIVYTGDIGMDSGKSKSVYSLDTTNATPLKKKNGQMFRVDLKLGETTKLPGGLGTVSFDGVKKWNRYQISRTPGMFVALSGVVTALIGLMLSLFVRPRRVWIRVRRGAAPGTGAGNDSEGAGDDLRVEVAGLDRSDGGDTGEELSTIVAAIGGLDDVRGADASVDEEKR